MRSFQQPRAHTHTVYAGYAHTILLGDLRRDVSIAKPLQNILAIVFSQFSRSAQMFSLQSGLGNAFQLTFPDAGSFKLRKSAHDLKEQRLHGRVLPTEDQIFLVEAHLYAALRHVGDKFLQVLQITSKPVYAMYMENVTFPKVGKTCRQPVPYTGRAAARVLKEFVQRHTFKLPIQILIGGTDPYIADVGHYLSLFRLGEGDGFV